MGVVLFERSHDLELVRSIVTHPKLYRPAILADYAPERDAWRAPEHRGLWYVVARDAAGAVLGLFLFEPHSPIWFEVHLCMLPPAWGRAREICLAAIDWLRGHSTCRKLTAAVPSYNRLTHSLARRVGMERVGVLTASILQNGRLCDQTLFALSI